MRTILMSIRKDPFGALLDKRKKHEFRKKFYINEPCQVVFYVSNPVKAICGVGIFGKPKYDTVDNLVEIIKTHSFSSEESLRSYLEGKTFGYALPINKIKPIEKISLDELRKEVNGFRPPESYCSLNFDKFRKLIERLQLYETPDETIQGTLF
jgi:predicted transcriptional regulator